jgi:hypothetical protein
MEFIFVMDCDLKLMFLSLGKLRVFENRVLRRIFGT